MSDSRRNRPVRGKFLNLLASLEPGADEAAETYISAQLKLHPVIPETSAAAEIGGKLEPARFRVNRPVKTAFRNAENE